MKNLVLFKQTGTHTLGLAMNNKRFMKLIPDSIGEKIWINSEPLSIIDLSSIDNASKKILLKSLGEGIESLKIRHLILSEKYAQSKKENEMLKKQRDMNKYSIDTTGSLTEDRRILEEVSEGTNHTKDCYFFFLLL